MPTKKKAQRAKSEKTASKKEKHYELLFPDPKGVPSFWFDQYSIDETPTHLIIHVGSSVGGCVFTFALSKSELAKQNFNFGTYVEGLRSFVSDEKVSASNLKRASSYQMDASPIHSIRYIRAARLGSDGELVLYTFATTTMSNHAKQSAEDKNAIEAEAVAVLHADLNPHYGLVLDLLEHTAEGKQ